MCTASSRQSLSDFEHEISPAATVLTDKIGRNVHIGAGCYICANVSIISPCKIGHNCEIFPGAVIGSDGGNYYKEDGIPRRSKHFKGVVIGDNVDIGANATIDRGELTDTVLCDNVKLGDLVHIAHNVRIEADCMVLAGAKICGSVRQSCHPALEKYPPLPGGFFPVSRSCCL